VFRNLPLSFHPNAASAAEAAMEAYAQGGDRAFWLMHDCLFGNQTDLGAGAIDRCAEQSGMNMPRLRQVLAAGLRRGDVARDEAIAQVLGVHGTPAFFINGRQVSGARPYDDFVQRIERARAEALAALARPGVTRENLYRVLTASPGAN
jgi:protein-disulfide isomerase